MKLVPATNFALGIFITVAAVGIFILAPDAYIAGAMLVLIAFGRFYLAWRGDDRL